MYLLASAFLFSLTVFHAQAVSIGFATPSPSNDITLFPYQVSVSVTFERTPISVLLSLSDMQNYDVLLLDVQSLDSSTASSVNQTLVEEYVQNGGKVVFVGSPFVRESFFESLYNGTVRGSCFPTFSLGSTCDLSNGPVDTSTFNYFFEEDEVADFGCFEVPSDTSCVENSSGSAVVKRIIGTGTLSFIVSNSFDSSAFTRRVLNNIIFEGLPQLPSIPIVVDSPFLLENVDLSTNMIIAPIAFEDAVSPFQAMYSNLFSQNDFEMFKEYASEGSNFLFVSNRGSLNGLELDINGASDSELFVPSYLSEYEEYSQHSSVQSVFTIFPQCQGLLVNSQVDLSFTIPNISLFDSFILTLHVNGGEAIPCMTFDNNPYLAGASVRPFGAGNFVFISSGDAFRNGSWNQLFNNFLMNYQA